MTDTNTERPIGTNPIADAASATAPSNPATSTDYSSDGSSFSSNADLRVEDDDDDLDDAAMSPTGLDIASDHADENPIDRSQDAPLGYGDDSDEVSELEDEDDEDDEDEDDENDDEQYLPVE